MGISEDDIDEHGGTDQALRDGVEELARREVLNGLVQRDAKAGDVSHRNFVPVSRRSPPCFRIRCSVRRTWSSASRTWPIT